MTTRAELLAWKRRQLLAECAMQREDLARQLRPVGWQLQSLESCVRIAGRLRRHPGWIAAASAAVLLLRPRRLSSVLQLAATGLRHWRSIAPTVQALLAGR